MVGNLYQGTSIWHIQGPGLDCWGFLATSTVIIQDPGLHVHLPLDQYPARQDRGRLRCLDGGFSFLVELKTRVWAEPSFLGTYLRKVPSIASPEDMWLKRHESKSKATIKCVHWNIMEERCNYDEQQATPRHTKWQ